VILLTWKHNFLPAQTLFYKANNLMT